MLVKTEELAISSPEYEALADAVIWSPQKIDSPTQLFA
jgi:hypothetical protein